MMGLDDAIAGLGGGGFAMAMVMAVLLGLRHATDPDHLTAVSTLVLSERRQTARRAGLLGLCWGLGHATTLFALGVPIVFAGRYLPDAVQTGAEVVIGVVIAALAVRLLVRWRRGYFHAHSHSHGSVRHSHPHAHEHSRAGGHPVAHEHRHSESLSRSPGVTFGVGLLHGLGGSGAFAALLVGAVSGRLEGMLLLLLFAGGTAASMVLVSWALGNAVAQGPALRRLATAVPVLGAVSLLFGAWYTLSAL
jgi:ABC-type nickel/cobalt efflux system permease component RcnA